MEMTNTHPTVSVVMATYNGEKFIREQIDSILNQTYPIHELIIQDDCSTDSTPAICREYEAKYPCVHFYKNEHNLGFNLNFKSAAMRATGDLVALSDQDDIWFKEKIEKQVAAIGDHDMCTCAICRGETMETAKDEPYRNDIRKQAHLFRCILGHTMLFKRGFVQDNQNWEGGLNYDWSLTLHADWEGGIIRVEESLVFHRTHSESFSVKDSLKMRRVSKIAPFLKGWNCFRRIQKHPKFIAFYNYIRENAHGKDSEAVNEQKLLSSLMLSKTMFGHLKLSLLCLKLRKKIYYPVNKANGIHGIIRGFFFPAIYAYYAPTIFYKK